MFNSDLLMENIFGSKNSTNPNNITNTTSSNVNEIEMPTATIKNNNINNQANQDNKSTMSLYNPKEAYEKGNLFASLYDSYKNFKPAVLEPKDAKEKLFLELSEMSFAAHELNLYLDVHPEDDSMIALFNDYRKRANKLTEEYESKYGPLSVGSNALEATPWMWTVQGWPWEGSGS